ncbi:hypothetical protein [Phenylobacterium sp.]|jgi:hypothetical protein|uniref:hypothetical protein n=1 Tax=Phenylobacterium sp. TaxID=1871053 RepID=UPI002F93EC70
MNELRRSRLRVGVDVPWVTSWSAEAVLGARPCATVAGRIAVHQLERPGYGRPNYSRNHLRRQRQSIARMLCPMCGRPTAAEDRWLQTGRRLAVGALRARGLGALLPSDLSDDRVVVDAGAIAPSHLACARRAAAHCPHLQSHTSGELMAFPEAWSVAPLLVRLAPPGPGRPSRRPAAAVAAISFLQLCGLTAERDPAWADRPGAALSRA